MIQKYSDIVSLDSEIGQYNSDKIHKCSDTIQPWFRNVQTQFSQNSEMFSLNSGIFSNAEYFRTPHPHTPP